MSPGRSDSGESWAERGAVRPGRRRRRLDRRLLRSLDGELKASVGQLAAMMGRIENELESLSAARGEMARVLGKLDKMDRKMRRRDAAGQPPSARFALTAAFHERF